MRNNIIIEIICSLLILLFVYAAATKLANYQSFRSQLVDAGLLNKSLSGIAWILPAAELVVAIMLAILVTRETGLLFSFLLMAGFTTYVIYMLIFSHHLPCSCGGVIRHLTWKQHLWMNIFFTLLSLVGIILIKKNKIVVQQ